MKRYIFLLALSFVFGAAMAQSGYGTESEFNPESPAIPSPNGFYPEQGLLVLDGLRHGDISEGISSIFRNAGSEGSTDEANQKLVTKVIICGDLQQENPESYPDFYYLGTLFENLKELDLSRTYGYTKVWSLYEVESMETLLLPDCLEEISSLKYCKNLMDVFCYADLPPAYYDYEYYRQTLFFDATAVTVHVPELSVDLYKAAEGWKDANIVAMENGVGKIRVNMPKDIDVKDYKNLNLILTDEKSGLSTRYVTSDRTYYLYPGLKNADETTWSVALYSRLGSEVASVCGIKTIQGITDVNLVDLKPVMTGSVRLRDGTDFLRGIDITWYDMKGTRLTSGSTMAGFVSGDQARVGLAFNDNYHYAESYHPLPKWITLTATENGADTVLFMSRLKTYTVKGCVRDAESRHPLRWVYVTASQHADDLSWSYRDHSYEDGYFILQGVREGEFELSFKSDEYSCKNIRFNTKDFTGEKIDVGNIYMKNDPGKRIVVNLSYVEAGIDIQDISSVNDFYSHYNDIRYTIFNNTTRKSVTDFSVIFPNIVIMSGVGDRDVLTVSLTSEQGDFDPVEETVRLIDGSGVLDARLVGCGGIQAVYKTTENDGVSAILYGSDGNMVDRYFYTSGSLSIRKLPSGHYTLVSMANDPVLTKLPTLDSYNEMGLTAGKDYVINSVTVNSGEYSQVKNEVIPTLDAEKYKLLHPSSTYSISSSNLLAGEYMTLRSRLLLKNSFATSWQYDGYELVLDIPDGCSYLDYSLLIDGNLAGCTQRNGKLTISGIDKMLENGQTIDVRLCLVAKRAGKYNVPAKLTYNYNGEQYSSPVGNVVCTVADLEYSIPDYSSDGRVSVSGSAAHGSKITLFDNDMPIGQTKVDGRYWIMNEIMSDTTNMSINPISIMCETPEGNVYKSTVKNVIVDKDMNRVSKVTMHYANGYTQSEEICIFDFINPMDEESYNFYPDSRDFTFVIDFIRNDPDEVGTVLLLIDLSDGETVIADARYDSQIKAWTASYTLNSRQSPPENVRVSYDIKKAVVHADRHQIESSVNEVNEFVAEFNALVRILSECNEDNIDEKIKAYENAVGYKVLDEPTEEFTKWETWLNQLPQAEFDAEVDRVLAETSQLLDSIAERTANVLAGIPTDGKFDIVLDDGSRMIVSDCAGYDENTILEGGFIAQGVNDGSTVYILEDSIHSVVVDFKSDRVVEIVYSKNAGQTRGVIEICVNGKARVQDLVDLAKSALNKILGAVSKDTGKILADLSRLKSDEAALQAMLRSDKLSAFEKATVRAQIYVTRANILSTDMVAKFAFKVPGLVKKMIPVVSYIQLASDFIQKFNAIESTYNSIPRPCPKDQAAANEIAESLDFGAGLLLAYCTGELAMQISSDIAAASSVAAAVPSCGASVVLAAAAYVAKNAAIMIADWAFSKSQDALVAQSRAAIGKLKCKKESHYDIPNNPVIPPDRPPFPDPVEPRPRKKKPLLDPSGFVCEAVESNRLEGVTATCYYKEEVEDMYGEKMEQTVVWDAENYGQQNPLLTDKQGMYSWMVPAGSWQVVYQKDGYETARSPWLPVPPPQLDVNVAMTQYSQPALASAYASEQSIDLRFSLYMKTQTVSGMTVTVTQNGTPVQGKVVAVNAESAFEGNEVYASHFRFKPDRALKSDSKVTVKVSSLAKSYAGVPIAEDIEMELTVAREIDSLGADSVVAVPCGGSRQLVVKALPAQAAALKTVNIRMVSDAIAGLETNSVLLDSKGQAYITIYGNLPGAAYMYFSLEGTEYESVTKVIVAQTDTVIPAAPMASIVSGTFVTSGTQVELSAQDGCTIWYTLDGSCPCDDTKSIQYTGPISITADTYLRAMAVAADGTESETVTYTWFVTASGLDEIRQESSGAIYDLYGRQLHQTPNGIYIQSGKKQLAR